MTWQEEEDLKNCCKKVEKLEKEVWSRIVRLEECLFEKVNPSVNGKSDMKEVIRKIVKEVLQESGIKNEINVLKEKQTEFQTTEQNLKDAKKELERKEEELNQKEKELEQLRTDLRAKEQDNSKLDEECISLKNTKAILDKKIGDLETQLSDLKTQLKESEENLEDKESKIQELNTKLNDTVSNATKNLEGLKEQLEREKNDLNNNWIEQKNNWIKQKKDLEAEDVKKREKIQKLESQLEEEREHCRILKGKKDDYKAKLENSTLELESLKISYRESCNKNQALSNEKEELIQEKNEIAENLKKVRFSLEEEEKKVKGYSDKFGIWDEATKKYQKLLDALLRCDSLSDMLEYYEIKKEKGMEDVNNILCSISMFGSESDTFLKNLHSFLERARQENKRYLSSEECYLFECLNQYYKEEDGVEDDLIRYPNTGDKFDKSMMVDMEYRNKIYRTVEGVYVPTIMRDERNPLLLALVKGV